MKTAIKYLVRSVYIIYDKLFPDGTVQDKNGKIRRKGLREFFVGYFLIMWACSYIARPLAEYMVQVMTLGFMGLCIHAFIIYCTTSPSTWSEPGLTAETLAARRRAREAQQTDNIKPNVHTSYPVYNTNNYGLGSEEHEVCANTSKQKNVPPKQESQYRSALEEAVISEVFYGIPFDPEKHGD